MCCITTNMEYRQSGARIVEANIGNECHEIINKLSWNSNWCCQICELQISARQMKLLTTQMEGVQQSWRGAHVTYLKMRRWQWSAGMWIISTLKFIVTLLLFTCYRSHVHVCRGKLVAKAKYVPNFVTAVFCNGPWQLRLSSSAIIFPKSSEIFIFFRLEH